MLRLLIIEERGSCSEEIFLSFCFFLLDLYSYVVARSFKLIWRSLGRVMANWQLNNFDYEIYVDRNCAFGANQMLPDMKLLISKLKVAMLHGSRSCDAVPVRTPAWLKFVRANVVQRILARHASHLWLPFGLPQLFRADNVLKYELSSLAQIVDPHLVMKGLLPVLTNIAKFDLAELAERLVLPLLPRLDYEVKVL